MTAESLKLSTNRLHSLIDRIRVPNDEVDAVDYFASLAWSVICEPGDAVAGFLIKYLGYSLALECEVNRISVEQYSAMLMQAGLERDAEFERLLKALTGARERWAPRLSLERIEHSILELQAIGGWFLSEHHPLWPRCFDDLDKHAPRGIWGLGDPQRLAKLEQSISVVGSRLSTKYGELAAGEIVGPLVTRGYSIVSGGAHGIDSHAHRVTLALGGSTVAVMAGGLDRLYPSGNRDLLERISETGLLLSEMQPGADPTKWRFLQRNRLIAAIGQATVLVEANPRSGAISTANRAIELDRPLGAVPGSINSAGSDGCHQLIREQKATLITCAEDVLELVGHSQWISAPGDGIGALETRVRDVIGHGDATFDAICSGAGLTKSEARLAIAELSALGLIEQNANGWRRTTL